jgi:glutathione S-transferase
MAEIKLTYFDAPGRAEPVRMALHMAGVPFEDHRIKFPEFMALKQSGAFPLGSVPVLEVDGFRFVQTAAMLRYVAGLGDTGLYPSDPKRALVVDSALDSLNDTLSNALLPSLFERDDEKKLAVRAAFVEGPMAKVYGYVSALIERFGGPLLGGELVSIADLVLLQNVQQTRSGGLDGLSAEHLEPYPVVTAIADAVLADPRVAAYLAR